MEGPSLRHRGQGGAESQAVPTKPAWMTGSAPDGWLLMASQLRRMLADPTLHIRTRACRDVIFRIPLTSFDEKEVLRLAQTYGPAEYVNRAGQKMAMLRRSFEVGAVAVEGSPMPSEEDTTYCHTVRFDEGEDAIRCVLHMNGAVLDHRVLQKEMELLAQLADENQSQFPEDDDSEEAQLWRNLDDAFKLKRDAASSRMQSLDRDSKNVVITCEFFRAAFNKSFDEPRQLMLYSAPSPAAQSQNRSLLSKLRAKKAAPAPTTSTNKPQKNPMDRIAERLYLTSKQFDAVYEQFYNGQTEEWQQVIFVANYCAFFLEEHGDVAALAHHVLTCCKDDAHAALSVIDTSESCEELWKDASATQQPRDKKKSRKGMERKVNALAARFSQKQLFLACAFATLILVLSLVFLIVT